MTSRRDILRCAAALAAGGLSVRAQNDPRTDAWIAGQLKVEPAMVFRGRTADEARAWQAAFRAKMRELLGDFAPPDKWRTHVEREVELADHTRRELLLSADGAPTLPVHLLIPKQPKGRDAKGRGPAAVALHGHGPMGYDPVAGVDDTPERKRAIAGSNYDYGRRLVRMGLVVACPCLQPFGRRIAKPDGSPADAKTDRCGEAFVRLQLLGKLLIAENLRDTLWARRLLVEHEHVDESRVACVGLSYGGRSTMLAAAMETGFAAAIVSGALNRLAERIEKPYSCGAQAIPGLLRFGDTPEIGALIAPRPAVWEWGSQDGLVPKASAELMIARMKTVYSALGAEDKLHIDRFEGGHRFNGAVALPLLQRWTLGKDEG